jgi:hypothetical protein
MADNIKKQVKIIVEYVIFEMMTKEYKVMNAESSNWNLNKEVTTLAEYIDVNCNHIMTNLNDRKYRKKVLLYNRLNEECNGDDDEDVIIELEEDIMEPIYDMFPNLVSSVHWDFACPIVNQIKCDLINIVMDMEK